MPEKSAVLVTGGAGFIGSHLCDALLARGERVICVDNFFTGTRENVAHVRENENFMLVEHDIVDPFPLSRIPYPLSLIYNLACPASPVHYQRDPVKTVQTNVVGTTNMLELARAKRAVFVQASTSEVYGDPEVHPQPETYVGHVNPLGPRACFSQDTEVLTKEGWKRFQDVAKKDQVATLDERGFIQYQKPTHVIRDRYRGDMIAFKSSKIDLLVTPNHRMYVRRRGQKAFELRPAYDAIRWERSEMEKSAQWVGREKAHFVLPRVRNSKYGNVGNIPMNDWLEFFGYYITEGCVHLRKRRRKVGRKTYETVDYNILIAQDRKNSTNRKKIERCLARLPFTYFSSDDHQFRITNKQLALYLSQFGKANEKFIPRELKNLSQRQLRVLFNAIMLGDGGKDGRAFYSNSTRLVGDFQEILLKLGMAGSVVVADSRKTLPVYHVSIVTDKKKDFLTPKYPKREIESYDGFVYCVTVPNGVIYVRRNGKALFCGNCYDEGKRCAETLCGDYAREYGLTTKIARIFNTYGPRMAENDGRVVSNFILQALHGEPITIFGDGSHTRSFQYVDDLVRGLLALADHKDFHGPVNIGTQFEMTVKELAELILKLTCSKSKIAYQPPPEDDPRKRRPDISLAKKSLGWEPAVSVEDGLKETIAYFRWKISAS